MTTIQKITRWAMLDVQHLCGRQAIIGAAADVVVEPVSCRADMCHEFTPVVKVTVPVVTAARAVTTRSVYYNNKEIARICDVVRVA